MDHGWAEKMAGLAGSLLDLTSEGSQAWKGKRGALVPLKMPRTRPPDSLLGGRGAPMYGVDYLLAPPCEV